jgi:amidase
MAVATVDHVVSRDEIVWAFGPDLEPVLEVEPGATVTFETNDCLNGVEIAGEVDIRFDLLKGKQGTWPVTELPDRWLPHATADDYDEALKLVSEEAARFLVDEWGFSIEDAFIFLSVACDAGVAQACKPAPGFGTIARFAIPKIEATPRPFRA